MRPLRAAFAPGYDPETSKNKPLPVTQEAMGMSLHHQKHVKAMLAGGQKGIGANARRSLSLVRNGFNKTE